MKRKLDSKTIANVEAAKRRGMSTREIAAKYGISVGSVVNAGRSPGKKQPLKSPPAAETVTNPVPHEIVDPPKEMTKEELRAFLTVQIRDLREQCEIAKTNGDAPGFNSASRGLASCVQLLARVMPDDDPAEKLGSYVTNESMNVAAEECKAQMMEYLQKGVEEQRNAIDTRDPGLCQRLFGPLRKADLQRQIDDLAVMLEFANG